MKPDCRRSATATDRVRRLARGLGVVVCSALGACAHPGVVGAPGSEPRIWDVRAQRFVAERALVADLAAASYRLLGEVHDNPAHHEIRARLIVAIARTGARPAIVFEQFDLDRDEALLAAQSAGIDAERLADAGGLDRKAWKWPLHKPLLEAALALRLPVRAGNLPRSQLRGDLSTAVGRQTEALWFVRFHAARWTDAHAVALHSEIAESHCRSLPEAVVRRFALAQRVRDAALAQALVRAATADGAVLIAGNGHVRADIAVPVYLGAPGLPGAQARSVSVGFVETGPDGERAGDFPRNLAADRPGYDYLWLTPAVERDDPCERLRKH